MMFSLYIYIYIYTNRLIWWSFYLLSSNRLIWDMLRTYIPKWPIDLLAHRQADFVSISWEELLEKKNEKPQAYKKNKNKLLWNPIILTGNRGIIIFTVTITHTHSGLYRMFKGFAHKLWKRSHVSLESNTYYTFCEYGIAFKKLVILKSTTTAVAIPLNFKQYVPIQSNYIARVLSTTQIFYSSIDMRHTAYWNVHMSVKKTLQLASRGLINHKLIKAMETVSLKTTNSQNAKWVFHSIRTHIHTR
jgi:hypothetical protein